MTKSEKSEKSEKFDDFSVYFTIINDLTLNCECELKKFLTSCIINDDVKLSTLNSELFDKNAKLFLAISIKKDSAGRDKWKACCVSKTESGDENLFCTRASSHNNTHECKQNAIEDVRKIFVNFHGSCDDDGSYTIIDALKSLDVFTYSTLDSIGRILIDAGLQEKFYTKIAAGRYVDILYEYLNGGNEVNFEQNQLKNLIHILSSKNFRNDQANVQLNVIKVLKIIKTKNFAKFNANHEQKIQKFLIENRQSYLPTMHAGTEMIKRDPRNTVAKSALVDVSQSRIEFLTCIAIFARTNLKLEDLYEILEIKNSSTDLKEKLSELENLLDKFQAAKSDVATRRSELMKLSYDIKILKKKVNFLEVMHAIKKELKIDEFINKFTEANELIFNQDKIAVEATEEISMIETNNESEKVNEESSNNIELSQGASNSEIPIDDYPSLTITSLLNYINSNEITNNEAKSILSIMTSFNVNSYDDLPERIINAYDTHEEEELSDDGYSSNSSESEDTSIIEHTSQDNHDWDLRTIVDFGVKKELKNPINYVRFLTKQIAENDEDTWYLFDALNKYEKHVTGDDKTVLKLLDNIKSLENQSLSKTDELEFSGIFFQNLDSIVSKNQKIPKEAFKVLSKNLELKNTYLIIKKILSDDNQTIPNEFINEMTKYLNTTNKQVTPDQLEIVDQMIKRGFIKLENIERFIMKSIECKEQPNKPDDEASSNQQPDKQKPDNEVSSNQQPDKQKPDNEASSNEKSVKNKTFKSLVSSALTTIYNAAQLDQPISSTIKNKIQNLSLTKENFNIVKFVTNSKSNLMKLTSGKTPLDEKWKIFEEVEGNCEKYRNAEDAEILIQIVLYDELISKRAFEVLTKILPSTFKLDNEPLCKLMLYAFRSNVDVTKVEDFLNQMGSTIDDVLEKCDDDIMREKLTEAFNFASCIELSSKNLEEVLKTTPTKINESKLSMLIEALENENYSPFYDPIIKFLKQCKLSESNYKCIKSFLLLNLHHSHYEDLLSLIPDDLQIDIKKIKNKPTEVINENIEKIVQQNTDHDAITALSNVKLLEHFNNENIMRLMKVCEEICIKIKKCEEEVTEIFEVKDFDAEQKDEVQLESDREELKHDSDNNNQSIISKEEIAQENDDDHDCKILMDLQEVENDQEILPIDEKDVMNEEKESNSTLESPISAIKPKMSKSQKIQKLIEKEANLYFSLLHLMKIISSNSSKLKKPQLFLDTVLSTLLTHSNMSPKIKMKVENAFNAQDIDESKVEFPNTEDTFTFIIANLYVITNQQNLNEKIFEIFSSNRWSKEVLISTLLILCEDYNDFDLEDFYQKCKNIKGNPHKIFSGSTHRR